jgi:hypothetical protein
LGRGLSVKNFEGKSKICDEGILEKKKVKVVKLPQFESLGRGLSVTFETLKVKVKISR